MIMQSSVQCNAEEKRREEKRREEERREEKRREDFINLKRKIQMSQQQQQ